MLALLEGFAGYSLPDDLLSGTGVRAAEGFIQSIPIIGSYAAYIVFGGAFPGEAFIPRLYSLHVLLIPAILIGLFTAHIVLVMVHKHTQYPGPGRTNENVVGFPFMPVYIAKAGGFFFIVFGVSALISGLVMINPIWAYGPYNPTQVTAGSQPDWYMGFADGALRLLPGFLEFELFGFTWSFNIFIGAIALIPILYTLLGAYPFIEAVGDRRQARAPRARPTAQRADADRPRRDGDLVLPRPVLRRRQRHHRHQAVAVDQRHHQLLPRCRLRDPSAGVLGDQADLPVVAAR